jgi:ribosomal protein S30
MALTGCASRRRGRKSSHASLTQASRPRAQSCRLPAEDKSPPDVLVQSVEHRCRYVEDSVIVTDHGQSPHRDVEPEGLGGVVSLVVEVLAVAPAGRLVWFTGRWLSRVVEGSRRRVWYLSTLSDPPFRADWPRFGGLTSGHRRHEIRAHGRDAALWRRYGRGSAFAQAVQGRGWTCASDSWLSR